MDEPTTSPFSWRSPRRDAFWRAIPAYSELDAATFLDHRWQERHAVTSVSGLRAAVGGLIGPGFYEELAAGLRASPMALRLPPYLVALVNWARADDDPIRKQHLPLAGELEPDHPALATDGLNERADAIAPGLIHRYGDRALLLATDTCAVYCRFCLRSYTVGPSTERVAKARLGPPGERWERAIAAIAERPAIEDVVISGGDVWRLKPARVRELGGRLLGIPHVRRVRFATRGLSALPMKVTGDAPWLDALTAVAEQGRARQKEVCVHTHFDHPNEVTGVVEDAAGALFERGITVRNQTVLLRGVNDAPGVLVELCRRLAWLHVHPYYVHLHDMVRGSEDLRTSLATAIEVEGALRGTLAGYNTPAFVVDLPGGGKRAVLSYERYDRETGIARFRAPALTGRAPLLFFDPLRELSPPVQRAWQDPRQARAMIDAARAA